jgi:hypothetical protein
MMAFVWSLLAVFGGIAFALVLGMALMRKARLSPRSSGLLFGTAMLIGLGNVFGGGKPEIVQESKDDANRKKDAQSGDPKTPDGPH